MPHDSGSAHEVGYELAPFEAAVAAVEEGAVAGERVDRGIRRGSLGKRSVDADANGNRPAARARLVEHVALEVLLHLVRHVRHGTPGVRHRVIATP